MFDTFRGMQFTLPLVPVRSSNLSAVGYDGQSARLTIRFHSGGTYEYYAVPGSVHRQLMSAPSLGAYFAARIRPIYSCIKISG